MRQHIRTNLTRLFPRVGIACCRHPYRQFCRYRPGLGDNAKAAAIRRWKINLFAPPQPAHLICRVKHRFFIVWRRVFRPQHKIIGMPAAGHCDACTPIGQVINHRPVFGNSGGMVQRHHARPGPHADIFGNGGHGSAGDSRIGVGAAKSMEMPFRRPDRAKPMRVGKLGTFQQQLIFLGARAIIIAPIIQRKIHLLRRCDLARRHQRPVLIRCQHHLKAACQRPEQFQH